MAGAGGTSWAGARYLIACLPSIIVATAAKHFLLNPRSTLLGWILSVLLAAVVAGLIIGIMAVISWRFSGGRFSKALAQSMPVGGTLAVDFYRDRLVTTVNSALPVTLMYSEIKALRVHQDMAILDRGGASAALPVSLVPPHAQALVESQLNPTANS